MYLYMHVVAIDGGFFLRIFEITAGGYRSRKLIMKNGLLFFSYLPLFYYIKIYKHIYIQKNI